MPAAGSLPTTRRSSSSSGAAALPTNWPSSAEDGPQAGRRVTECRDTVGECVPAWHAHPPAVAEEYLGDTEGILCTRIPPVSFSAGDDACASRWRPEARCPPGSTGAWWPYSRDLAAELPAPTDVLDTRRDRITRVTVNPACWPVIPRKVQVGGRVVKVGWSSRSRTHTSSCCSPTAGPTGPAGDPA
ncbi:hypothetical protein SBRY_110107 [Actinacidiphila bryophytorum]|uniref:Uncharacterized protein n=1 Tax=Actinacidiphila bryophytorum TaxID=1436133 RepID=A0A9W4GYP3_9ACTN|nr:hypothetical protein SBRY_110107 [Actinacidiphila bryophytorum]